MCSGTRLRLLFPGSVEVYQLRDHIGLEIDTELDARVNRYCHTAADTLQDPAEL
jgi:hypothetical protein